MRKLLNCDIAKLLTSFLFYEEEKVAKFYKEIYSVGKGENPPGDFRFGGTRKTDSKFISQVFCQR